MFSAETATDGALSITRMISLRRLNGGVHGGLYWFSMGSPIAAGMILFLVALLTAGVVFLFSGGSLRGAVGSPPHLFFAGCLVAFYVLTITWVAPSFGVGNAVFFVLLGQLISAAAIDHYGLFGAQPSPLSFWRLSGIAVMGLGVFLTQIAGRS